MSKATTVKTWFVIEEGKMGTYAEQVSSEKEAEEQATERARRKPGCVFIIFEAMRVVRYPTLDPIIEELGHQPIPHQQPRYGPRYRDGHSDKGIRFRELIFEILETKGGPMSKPELRHRFLQWPFEGRVGHRFASNTFTAEFGKMVKAGLVIVDHNDMVRIATQSRRAMEYEHDKRVSK